jgi:hypothetical protein
VNRTDVTQLTGLFKHLGARDPEAWARSEVAEGIPQLERFLFLRQAWSHIVQDGDSSWIQARVSQAKSHPTEPYAGTGQALQSLLAKGATTQELIELVRGMQAELLFQLCYLLEDPALNDSDVSGIAWGLFTLDPGGMPKAPLTGLHESVLETDPTGREMRPRDSAG